MRKLSRNRNEEIIQGGPNIFADLGIPNAEERLAKVHLVLIINKGLDLKAANQKKAALLLDCTQPDVSMLRNYKTASFSLERLLDFLHRLGQDVEITIRKKARTRKAGATTVRMIGAA